MLNGLLVENAKIVVGAIGLANAGAIDGDRVSLKNYGRVAIILAIDPGAGTAATAVTLKQSKTVDDSPSTEKALEFTKMWKNANNAASDTLVETAVAANTFSTSVAAASELFVIEVKADDLDVANGFDCVRIALSDPGSDSTPVAVIYVLYEPRYSGATPPSAIVD